MKKILIMLLCCQIVICGMFLSSCNGGCGGSKNQTENTVVSEGSEATDKEIPDGSDTVSDDSKNEETSGVADTDPDQAIADTFETQDSRVSDEGTANTDTTTEEPFSEMDFEEEVTIPIEEYEGVGGL